MKLSIIIPVYNEEKTIREVISRVRKVNLGKGIEKEIIVVDDGSTDGSQREIKNQISKIKNTNQKLKIKLIENKRNQGKGAAVRKGIKKSSGEVIIIQDADLEYSPSDYPKLLRPIVEENAQVVYGTRMYLQVKPEFFLSYLGNRVLSLFTNLVFGSNLIDVFVCYKVFKKEALRGVNLRSNGFEIETELTAKFLKKGIKIKEAPISYQGRSWREGKKINFWDGLISLFYIFYYRFFD